MTWKYSVILRIAGRLAAFGLLVLLSSGCVTVEMFKNGLTYMPAPVSTRIDARVSLDVTHTVSPESRLFWQSWGNGPETIGNWELAVRAVIVDDIVISGLFSSVQVDGIGDFDYLVRIRTQDLRGPDRFVAELQVCDWSTKNVRASYKREAAVDGGKFDQFKNVIQSVMVQLKSDVQGGLGRGALPATVPTVVPAQPGPEAPPQI